MTYVQTTDGEFVEIEPSYQGEVNRINWDTCAKNACTTTSQKICSFINVVLFLGGWASIFCGMSCFDHSQDSYINEISSTEVCCYVFGSVAVVASVVNACCMYHRFCFWRNY